MAQFLRIGSMIVNLENVTHIEETSEFVQAGVAIAFVGGDDRLFVTDEQQCTVLRGFIQQQQAMGTLVVEKHNCQTCDWPDAMKCEGCGEWACRNHSAWLSIDGIVKHLCDPCRGIKPRGE